MGCPGGCRWRCQRDLMDRCAKEGHRKLPDVCTICEAQTRKPTPEEMRAAGWTVHEFGDYALWVKPERIPKWKRLGRWKEERGR